MLSGPSYPERKAFYELSRVFNVVGLIVQINRNQNISVLKSDRGDYRSTPDHFSPFLFPYFNYSNSEQESILGSGSLAWFASTSAKVYSCLSINDNDLLPIIESLKPTIIMVFGTGIIKNQKMLNISVPIYNFHWGISPYYRGSYTLRWPIYNNELEFVGVTLHRLNAGIDAGPIVDQKIIELDGSESQRGIEYKATLVGINLMISLLHRIINKESIPLKTQDLNKGKLYSVKQWNQRIDNSIETMLEDGIVFKNAQSNLYPL
jgi:folate-dependent phosphoribosylglycinamide formyltransferase PurN